MKKFRQNLMSELPVISAEEREKVVEIARKAFGSDDFSFERKYKIATLNADDDIMKIINLSDDDFTLTKKVRNKIAHGDDPGLKQEQFPVVMRAVSKIALLLTYWSFLDFGFTTHEFITYLEKTHSKLARHAIINKAYMARVTGSAEFLPVTKEILQLFQEKKVSGVYGCWVEDKAGKLTFSKYFTKKYRDWMHDSTKTSNRHDPEKIFGICKDKARLIGRGYFECGDEYQEFHHSWIIRQTDPAPNMPPVPS
ncbi:HEPN domain-containing protein [Novacetimonas cocois]|uniref:HEPN domain-containing protein n=1 Tax=Novacetimonas cocois TaxID=1747507 RepID=UPI00197EB514|nr:HEPN domain-containing protein [Novacetimonas cocois]